MLEHVIFFACGASYYHYNYYTHVVTILFIREVLLKKSIDTTCRGLQEDAYGPWLIFVTKNNKPRYLRPQASS